MRSGRLGAMRIWQVVQPAKSWPDATLAEREEGVRLADNIEHIHWRLWHGQVRRSLDLIGETLARLEATAQTASPNAPVAAKLVGVLRSLETYVSGQSDMIIDY